MKVLVVGGGREHALAWKAAQSPKVDEVFVAPGNAGIATEQGLQNIDINAEDVDGLLAFAQQQAVDLTIVGPEAQLVAGIVDRFTEAGLAIFGPTAAAAQLEGSKAFSKDFLQRHNIPTAAYQNFTDRDAAKAYVRQQPLPIVIKADGLAAGKGVIIAETLEQADSAIDDMLPVTVSAKPVTVWLLKNFYRVKKHRLLSWLTVKTPLLLPPVKTTKHVTTATRGQTLVVWALTLLPLSLPRRYTIG